MHHAETFVNLIFSSRKKHVLIVLNYPKMDLWALWCGNTTPRHEHTSVFVPGMVHYHDLRLAKPRSAQKTRSCLRGLARVRGLSPAAALTFATRAPTLLNVNARGANVNTC
jgi:hypothetical protein